MFDGGRGPPLVLMIGSTSISHVLKKKGGKGSEPKLTDKILCIKKNRGKGSESKLTDKILCIKKNQEKGSESKLTDKILCI